LLKLVCLSLYQAENNANIRSVADIHTHSDLVVASPTATFGLPEVARGIYATAGGLPRIMRTCGLQIASEIALTGRRLSAQEAKSHGLINRISKSQESCLQEAVELASEIAAMSPDAIFVTRQGLREAWETASVERAVQITGERWGEKLMRSENTRIGLEAFARKEMPKWVPSKL
jgi:enoyl-CoA hydratase/carnithine racemase